MKYFIVLLVLALGSCAPSEPFVGKPTNKYDHVLIQFNSDLVALGYEKINFSGLTIRSGKFSGSESSLNGKCYSVGKRQFGVVDISLKENLTPSEAMGVLYHEIGHCFLGLGHSDHHTIMQSTVLNTPVWNDFVTTEGRRNLVNIMVQDSLR